MNVVVVESPAKAKTINKYLGKDYKVLASYGHVRDLPAKDGSVRPDEGFAMTYGEGLRHEHEVSVASSAQVSAADVAGRKEGVQSRGRRQSGK